jgi:cobaltochelatase CobS
MRDQLLALPKTDLLDLFSHLNGGTVGFDHERTKKAECVDRMVSMYTEAQIRSAMDLLTPRPATPATPAPGADQTAIAQQIGALFASLAGSAVNEDKVRQIVQGEVQAALERSPVVRIEVGLPDGSTRTPKGHVREGFADILRDASVGLNILLVGPAGSGKTHLGHQVAEALGREFASVSCTTGMSESVLSGWLLPGEGGAFEYVESDFVRLYENGGVFLFDEVDAADPNTLLFINQALANGSFFVPQRKGRSKVTRHADFVCVAAANTFGNGANGTYAGRERLDEAFLDRFRAGRHFVDYDKAFERSAVSPDLLAWGWAVRKRMEELRMQRVMSTRFLLDSTKALAAGKSVDAIKATFFLDWKADDRKKVDA